MCPGYRILYGCLPVSSLRAWIIRRHVTACPHCRKAFPPTDRAERVLAETPSWIAREPSLWPAIHARIRPEVRPRSVIHTATLRPPVRNAWRWGVAGLSLAIVLGVNLLIREDPLKGSGAADAASAEAVSGVTVRFAEVKGKKARHHIYRTSSGSYIWFAQSKDSGGE